MGNQGKPVTIQRGGLSARIKHLTEMGKVGYMKSIIVSRLELNSKIIKCLNWTSEFISISH